MIMDYKTYCENVLLSEENQKEVYKRLWKAFPNQHEFKVYKSILDMFPSLNAKSIITSVLIRSKIEREKRFVNVENTKKIFEEFIQLLKRNMRVDLASILKKDRVDHPTDEDSEVFTKFTEEVHRIQSILLSIAQKKLQKKNAIQIKKDTEETITTKFPNPIYTDDQVEIYQAKSPGQARAYEGDSAICLKYSSYFYGTYRIPNQSAFYFVFPKSPKETFVDPRFINSDNPDNIKKAPRHRFLLVDLHLSGSCYGTWEDNVMNRFNSLEELAQKFPFIQKALSKGVFKKNPLSDEEKNNWREVENMVDDNQFMRFSPLLKDLYISTGHDLSDKQWNSLPLESKNDYINLSVERDLTDHQYEDIKKHSQLYKRYIAIKKRGLEVKIKNGTFASKGLTKHEASVLPNLLSSLTDEQKSSISNGLIKTMKDILIGGTRPMVDISGVYNLFKGQLLSDPQMQTSETFTHIADILGGQKTRSWKSLQDDIKIGVYNIATDLYKANPEKIDPLIEKIIGSNLEILLESLITVPTSFQINYFEKNKKELLSDDTFANGLKMALSAHLIHGTELPHWLKGYWKNNKNDYLSDPEFSEKLKSDLQHILYGIDSSKYPSYADSPDETKELYDKFITNFRKDPKTRDIVSNTMYDIITTRSMPMDIDQINNWNISDECKRYIKEHEKSLKTHLAFKVIDVPPQHETPAIKKLQQEYASDVFANPEYRKLIEERLINDIVDEGVIPFWSGPRIDYWMKNLQNILNKHPGTEEKLFNKMKQELGMYNTANAFYTEWGIPFSFYKKYENRLFSNGPDTKNGEKDTSGAEAFRGMVSKIKETLQFRKDKKATDEDAAKSHLSAIELDFFNTHRDRFPHDEISPNSVQS